MLHVGTGVSCLVSERLPGVSGEPFLVQGLREGLHLGDGRLVAAVRMLPSSQFRFQVAVSIPERPHLIAPVLKRDRVSELPAQDGAQPCHLGGRRQAAFGTTGSPLPLPTHQTLLQGSTRGKPPRPGGEKTALQTRTPDRIGKAFPEKQS